MECSKCGVSGETMKLFEVISDEGIVKVCQRCLFHEGTPVIQKPTESQFKSVLKKESVYKRLSNSAGLDPEQHRMNMQRIQLEQSNKKHDTTLRDLVDRKFDGFAKTPVKKRDDLINNFHWVIMRARRAKKMTIPQLAKEMGEPERALKMAEQGVLAEGDYAIVDKFEKILGINILMPEVSSRLKQKKKQLGFDDFSTQNLTISDLKDMKKEAPAKGSYWKRFLDKIMMRREKEEVSEQQVPEMPKEEPKSADEELEYDSVTETPVEFDDTSLEISERERKRPEDFSKEDIDDIIFGRK